MQLAPDNQSIETTIRQQSAALGFSTIGWTNLEHASTPSTHLQSWLDSGRHGDMAWMTRNPERRSNPKLILRSAQSIICLALNYYTPQPPTDNPLQGRIARYARGDDYHKLMLERLRRLLEVLRLKIPDFEGLAYVDTGPIMEKYWAAQAGLGWQGKNTNLIDPRRGSWFFLGEIVTNIKLSPISTARKGASCGKCTKCIQICPTRAITAPYQLDARRCISYLTIEHKGSIPEELRPLLGNHIYGCDLCQEVCPWNRFATATLEPAFQVRENNFNPELLKMMQMTDEEFRERFRGSPIKRIKRRRLLRNVAVALGNSKNPAAIPTLQAALLDHEPLIREHASWALKQLTT